MTKPIEYNRSKIKIRQGVGLRWDINPAAFIAETEKKVQDLRAKLVRNVFDKAVAYTPVDTGRARRSWRIAIGAPDTSYEPKNTMKRILGKPKTLTFKVLREVPLTTQIYISNSVPYAPYLEYGSPTTPEHAMLRRAIAGSKA